jgi:hypothetical protein
MRRNWVTLAFLPGWLALALSAGCFNPRIQSGGFACDPSLPQPCPVGFRCVDHLCVDHAGLPGTGGNGPSDTHDLGGADASAGGGADMAAPGAADMSHPVADMAKPPADMTQPPPPDMAKPVTCAHDKCTTGDPLKKSCDPCVTQICAADSACCSSTLFGWDDICVEEVSSVCGLSCP